MIPQADPHANYAAHQAEIDAALARALASGRYILGPEVRAFEDEFAAWQGLRHAVGVGSGTDALVLALRALDLPPGSEVVTVAHTAVATVAAVELAGLTPVLVDIDPRTYTLDPARLAAVLTPRTRALIPVHLYGQPADLDPILAFARAHGLRVVEDCAQAHGATYHGRRVGTLGDIAAFSFYPTKNLGAIGDGGLVATSDAALAERVRLLQQYGWRERYVSDIAGMNSRLDELQAALLRVKLRYLDAENERRRTLAALYDEWLPPGLAPAAMPDTTSVYHLYVVRTPRRDDLAAFLRARGIGTGVHYPVPVHRQPAYAHLSLGEGSLPETEAAAREILSLPLYPELSEEQVRAVAEAVRAWAAQ
jgi:dTDP-3-amino-3,4,6-trideoxy-alpha-D-glucose transaminase